MKAITVCVNYDDLLAITLPRNAAHFEEVMVVTSPEDHKTRRVVWEVQNAFCYVTNAFTLHGASFNKGYALELAFDVLGRNGWIAVIDADTLLPDDMHIHNLQPTCLYSAPRRILRDPKQWSPAFDWSSAPILPVRPNLFPGYFHLFHAFDPALQPLPWYDVTLAHAGGGDGFFQSRWPKERKVWLPFEVLHLGVCDCNWYGRTTQRLSGEPPQFSPEKMMGLYDLWRTRRNAPAHERYGDRVDVPGHHPRPWVYE